MYKHGKAALCLLLSLVLLLSNTPMNVIAVNESTEIAEDKGIIASEEITAELKSDISIADNGASFGDSYLSSAKLGTGADSDTSIVESGTCGDNIIWTLNADGVLIISGTGNMWDYFIDSPWKQYASIKTVVIENGVTSIGAYSFFNCNSIETVEIPDSVSVIGKSAFIGNTRNLVAINVAENNPNYRSIDGVLFNKDGTVLIRYPIGKTSSTYTIPSNTLEIDTGAFASSHYLEEVIIPDGLNTIGDTAFSNATALKEITIPKGVTGIGYLALSGCYSLNKIEVDTENTRFSSEDGVLFSKDKKELIQYPIGTKNSFYAIPNGVTTVEDSAFDSCESLSNVTIPDSVVSINMSAFSFCTLLTEVHAGNSIKIIEKDAFSYCNSLQDVFYNGTEAQWKAIDISEGNSALTEATIHYDSSQGAGEQESEFIDSGTCGENLTWTFSKEGVLTISGIGEMDNWDQSLPPWNSVKSDIQFVIINDGVTSIGNYAFYRCGSLKSVELHEGVKSIGKGAFSNTSLKSIQLPNGVTNVGDQAFNGCTSLRSVQLPEGVESIGEATFCFCNLLDDITLPQSITSIGRSAFRECNISSIVIPDGITCINDTTFYGCNSLRSITLPDGLTSIGDHAFHDCHVLRYITIPNSVQTIGKYAFDDCSGLRSVTLPDRLNIISDHLFYGCRSLENIVIKEGATIISWNAFENCGLLKTVTLPLSLSEIKASAFYNCTNLSDVFYAGGKYAWDQIDIKGRNEGNSCLTGATIHYNSTGSQDRVSDLNVLLSTLPEDYNDDLALIAANLSLKTYDNDGNNDDGVKEYLTNVLGFSTDNIHSKNYGGSYAFTIATKEYLGDDADEILVIVAQGSTNVQELFGDTFSDPDYEDKARFDGYAPYKVSARFLSEIINSTEFQDSVDKEKTYKILITGHSLGGAVSNLLAKGFTKSQFLRVNSSKANTFCYTFGAIDSIVSSSPVVEGYENIHNVYNELDTFSPTQSGTLLMSGAGSRNGKFGFIEAFEYEYRTKEQQQLDKEEGLVKQALRHINHDMSNYVEAIESGKVKNSPLRPGNAGSLDLINGTFGYSIVACPVDVDVFHNGILVGRIFNNEIDTSVTGVGIIVEDDIKFILYPDDAQYDLNIRAYDEGSMVFLTQNLTGSGKAKTVLNVTLSTGKTMSSSVGGDIETEDVTLYVVNDDGEPIAEVQEDGTEVPIQLSVTKTNIQADSVFNTSGYGSLTTDYKYDGIAPEATLIDRNGEIIFRDTNTFNRYYVSDDIVSLVSDSPYSQNYKSDRTQEPDIPAFYHLNGDVAFSGNIWGATPIRDGYAFVTEYDHTNVKSYIIDEAGQIVLNLENGFTEIGLPYAGDMGEGFRTLSMATWFSEGLLPCWSYASISDCRKNIIESIYYIDVTGETVFTLSPSDYSEFWPFYDGLAGVRSAITGKIGYIDKTGNLVIPCEYDTCGRFADGIAHVSVDGKYGYINHANEVVIPFEYDGAYGAGGGLASVVKNGKCGLVDYNNNVIVPLDYDDITTYDGDVAYAVKDGYVYIISGYKAQTEHQHDWNDGVITTPASCTEDGVITYTCPSCGETKTEAIPATGHDWGEWVQTKAPTETEVGEQTRACKHDPSHIETMEIPPLGSDKVEVSFLDEEVIIVIPNGAVPSDAVFSVIKIVPPPEDVVEKVKDQCGSNSTVLAYYEVRLIAEDGTTIIYLDGQITIKTKMAEQYIGSSCVNVLQEDETGKMIEMTSWWEGDYLCYSTDWLEIYD